MDPRWFKAAGDHAKAIPAQFNVIGFDRVRPLFTAETEWPWPDGRYFLVTDLPLEQAQLLIARAKSGERLNNEFQNYFDASAMRDWLNGERKLAPRRARSDPASTTVNAGRPERWKAPSDRRLTCNPYTVRPKR